MRKWILGLVVIGLCLVGGNVFAEGVDEYTVLMLHFDGTDGSTNFVDDSWSNHPVTAHGDAQIDTAQSRFGDASVLFDEDGDYLTIPDSPDWDFGTGDFTIDFWVRFIDASFYDKLLDMWHATRCQIQYYAPAGGIGVYIGGSITYHAWSPVINTWYHIALARSGTTAKFFIDGIQIGDDIINSYDISGNTNIGIGGGYNGDDLFNGWMDEVRISKGIARWTSEFTPPTYEYGSEPNTPPVADAGYDEIAYADEIVTLDGGGSYSIDGDIVNYTWTRLLGNVVLYSGSEPTYDTTALGWVEEIIVLTVTDNYAATATDMMSILKPDLTPEQVAAMQAEIDVLEQQANDNRLLLEQLPQLRKALEALQPTP